MHNLANGQVGSEAADYGMDAGFYLIAHANKVFPVINQLIDGLVHVG